MRAEAFSEREFQRCGIAQNTQAMPDAPGDEFCIE
jgi:hypothetical protein